MQIKKKRKLLSSLRCLVHFRVFCKSLRRHAVSLILIVRNQNNLKKWTAVCQSQIAGLGKWCMYGFSLIVSSVWGVSAAVGRLQVVWVVPARRGQELWSAFSTAVSPFAANRTHKCTHIHTLCSYSLSRPIFKPTTHPEPLFKYTF